MTTAEVLFMNLQMAGHLLDALRQQRDLYLRGSGILLVDADLLNRGVLCLCHCVCHDDSVIV